jgi:hypothetical protein
MTEDKVTIGQGAIALIQQTAVEAAARPKIMDIAERDDYCIIVERDCDDLDRLRFELMPPIARDHAFETVAALIEFSNNCFAGKHGLEQLPVVWYDKTMVSVVVNDEDRRDVGRLALNPTPQITELTGNSTKTRTQKEFIRYLRINLAGTLGEDARLLSVLRELKFSASSDGEGTVRHGQESMGKKINAAVLGIDAIPEEVTLYVRVFQTPDLTQLHPVRCAIDILPDEQAFRLVPLPMQVENAIAAEVEEVGAMLASQLKCPVYRGRA